MAEQKLKQSFVEVQADLDKIESTPEFNSVSGGLAIVNKSLTASGLQREITDDNLLSSDLVSDDGAIHKFVTAADKEKWDGKQDRLTAGEGITIKDGVISASIVMPFLIAPTVSRSGTILQITDESSTSGFVANYLIYVDSVVAASTTAKTYDLAQIDFTPGTHAIGAVACAPGFFNSPLSNIVNYSVYGINTVVGHGTYSGDVAVAEGETATVIVTAGTGYDLPDTISVTNADYTYNKETGVINLSNPVGTIVIAVECDTESYSVAATADNGTITGPSSISYGGSATYTITANYGYELPDTVLITGDIEYNYDKSTGQLVLSGAHEPVAIYVNCTLKNYVISKTCENGSLSGEDTMTYDETVVLTVEPNTGYKIPSNADYSQYITVRGASYTYNASAGTINISEPTADMITVAVECPLIIYNIYGSITNGQKHGDTTIGYGSTASVTIQPNTGYKLPLSQSDVLINGATGVYNPQTGVISLSAPTGDVTISATCPIVTYNITRTITHGSATGATTIPYQGTANIQIVPAAGYANPENCTVVNAQISSYNSMTGELVIANPTGDVTITASCRTTNFTITANITNGTSNAPSTISTGSSATITITPNQGYLLPESVIVQGATLASYSSTTGVMVINTPTAGVVITANCRELPALTAPSISLSGDTLHIVDNDGKTESYDIYDNGVYLAKVAKQM